MANALPLPIGPGSLSNQIGNGETLPADGSTYHFYTTPTGMFRWDAATSTWVRLLDDIWYDAQPAADEIGHGDILPGDGSEWQFFELEGNPVMPDSLYRWSDSGAWVQI